MLYTMAYYDITYHGGLQVGEPATDSQSHLCASLVMRRAGLGADLSFACVAHGARPRSVHRQNLELSGLDSSMLSILRGGIPKSIGNSQNI